MNSQPAIPVMKVRGFSLLELIVALVIVGIVLVMAMPAFSDQIDKRRLVAAADALYGDLQYARSEAIRNNLTLQMNFKSGSNWCYGIGASATACDCSLGSSSCSLKLVNSSNYAAGAVSIASSGDITFSGSNAGFDPVRGVASPAVAGYVDLTSAKGKKARVSLSLLGRVNVCAPASSGVTGAYPSC